LPSTSTCVTTDGVEDALRELDARRSSYSPISNAYHKSGKLAQGQSIITYARQDRARSHARTHLVPNNNSNSESNNTN
jgi:hypothetical protein